MDSEEAYIKYTKGKKKTPADAEKFERGWNKDKNTFVVGYQGKLSKMLKKTELDFNLDNPKSDYKMVIEVQHIDTGTPVKKSSATVKIQVYDLKTDEKVAEIFVPKAAGVQLGPMTPTVGMRVNYAFAVSASILGKYIKKQLK